MAMAARSLSVGSLGLGLGMGAVVPASGPASVRAPPGLEELQEPSKSLGPTLKSSLTACPPPPGLGSACPLPAAEEASVLSHFRKTSRGLILSTEPPVAPRSRQPTVGSRPQRAAATTAADLAIGAGAAYRPGELLKQSAECAANGLSTKPRTPKAEPLGARPNSQPGHLPRLLGTAGGGAMAGIAAGGEGSMVKGQQQLSSLPPGTWATPTAQRPRRLDEARCVVETFCPAQPAQKPVLSSSFSPTGSRSCVLSTNPTAAATVACR